MPMYRICWDTNWKIFSIRAFRLVAPWTSSATLSFISGVTASRCGADSFVYQREMDCQSGMVLTSRRWTTV